MALTPELIQAFSEHPHGLCGQHDPAQIVSSVSDIEQRLCILTLGSVLDINPLSPERWSKLVALAGHWLLEPSEVAHQPSQGVLAAMQERHILGPGYIARVWWQLSRGVQGRYKGSWQALIADQEHQARTLQRYLRRNKATFPVLAGPVISARWLDLIQRIGPINIQGWEALTLPLPAKLKKKAHLFGIEEDAIHPMYLSALHTWDISCKKMSVESCGFASCPRR
jgi:hypothetical protein